MQRWWWTAKCCPFYDKNGIKKVVVTKSLLKRLWKLLFQKTKLNETKSRQGVKCLRYYARSTPRLKLEWNLKMRYNSQMRKWIYQLWQVIIRLLRWQIHEKMAIFRLKSNFTNIAPLCTWMPVELNFVIFLGITHFFSLFWIGQSKSARYYTNRFVYIQNAIKNCQKLCCKENGQLTTGVEKERSTSFRWKGVGRHWAVDWEHDKQYAVVLLQSY